MASKAINEKSGGRKTASTRENTQSSDRSASEASGVMLIAGGVLAIAYLFFSATGYLGEVLGKALFGLIGILAYLLPVILIAVGILYIRGSATGRLAGSGWYLLLGILAMVTLFQTIRDTPYEGVDYMTYLNSAYSVGQTARIGGGFIGAVLSYPLLLLGGKTLSIILSVSLVLVCIIAITGFSLRVFTENMSDKIANAVERSHETQVRNERDAFSLSLDNESSAPTVRNRRVASAEDILEIPVAKSKTKRAQPEPEIDLFEKPAKSKKAVKTAQAQTELQEFSAMHVDFKKNPSEPQKRKRPVTTNIDILSDNDFEPDDDVPLVVKGKKPIDLPRPVVQLPDTTSLFGAQIVRPTATVAGAKVASPATSKGGAPARQPGVKTQTPPKQRTLPEVRFAPGDYIPPSMELLNKPGIVTDDETDSPEEKARILIDTLHSFRISAQVTNIAVGPALTRIEIQPAPGTRISRITALQNDITMALSAPRLRLEAPIPGKNAIGIEIPNKGTSLVLLRDILESKEFRNSESPVTMALGREASGKVIVADLTRMPHMLIAGATGSGKSVCINDIIIGMLYKSSPADVRFILVDPKRVEMSMYGSLPHLLIPVVTEPKKAAGAMRWAVNEMTNRYKIFSDCGVRNLDKYNERAKTPEEKLFRVVVIIDELADLMMFAPDEVEDSIQRIAQLGRAAGIHLILATQRPDASVITGLIKSNITSRAAFAVNSALNSRIILDMSGAEKLLGHGDMLFHPDGSAKPTRLQCAYIADEEVERIVQHFKENAHPAFDNQILSDVSTLEKMGASGGAFGEGKQEDEMLGAAVRVVFEHGQASTSMLQRRLRVGYSRASRLIDMMEQHGYVSGFNGSKAREVLIKRHEIEELFGGDLPVVEPPQREPNPMSAFYSEKN